MTKVRVEPGICGFTTLVTAEDLDDDEVRVRVASGCKAEQEMMAALGDTFCSFEVCLAKPGKGPFYEYAAEYFPVHAACPVLAGIGKCVEAEAKLALKRDVTITFVEE